MNAPAAQPLPEAGRWSHGPVPRNVHLGADTFVAGNLAFLRFQSTEVEALTIGQHCTMDGVHFAVGRNGRVVIGDYCYFTNAVLLSESEIRFGSYVVLGWNTTITDADFHPLDPADRIADAIACSPLGKGRARPDFGKAPVIIEDNVWIGPSVTILKGVRIGAGAFIEPGSLVTRDVPSRARVLGNPAQIIGQVP